MFDLAYVRPDFWSDGEDYVPNSAAVSSKHFLSEDFCVLNGEHYFVRCVLRLPLLGVPDTSFAFGVWSTLSEKNFELYKDAFDSGDLDGMGPWFGWLSNRMDGYADTLNLKCRVHPESRRRRPWIELEATDHPLSVEMRKGITVERLVAIYSGHGHIIELDGGG